MDRINDHDKIWHKVQANAKYRDVKRESLFKLNAYDGFRVPDPAWECERIEMPSREEFFEKYISQRKPVIIIPPAGEEGFEHFGWAVKSWLDLDSLAEKVGKMEVNVEQIPQDGMSDTSVSGVQRVRFPKFLRSLQNPKDKNRWYMNVQNEGNVYSGVSAALQDDFNPDDLEVMSDLELKEVNLWFSGNTKKAHKVPAITPLHYDAMDNMYAIVSGKKTFSIFSPADAFNVYTKHGIDTVAQGGNYQATNFAVNTYSALRSRELDSPAFTDLVTGKGYSQYAKAVMGKCHVNQGELFYLPSGWFHQVTTHLGLSFAINFWFRSPAWGQPADDPYGSSSHIEQQASRL
jgi:hypothetical protein